MYSDLAPWFHLLTHPSDYWEEAAFVTRVVDEVVGPDAQTLLELGSGGGNNASHLKARFTCTLTDLSPEMLALSRSLNPECEHVEGDMRTLRLGRTFDVVFVHDAIGYLTSEEDLAAAIETAAVHVRPGGVVDPHARRDDRDLCASHGSGWPRRRRRARPPLPRVDPPRRSTRRHDLCSRLRDRGPGARRARARGSRPPRARPLPEGDLGASDRAVRPRAGRHHRREPVRARAGRVRRPPSICLTTSGRTSTLSDEHTFVSLLVPEPWRPRC